MNHQGKPNANNMSDQRNQGRHAGPQHALTHMPLTEENLKELEARLNAHVSRLLPIASHLLCAPD